MRRGEVWWADLGAARGSAPARRRPVLIVQSDDFNRSDIRTVVTLAITSNLHLAAAPGNVLCRPRASGLPKPSVINVSQMAAVDRGDLLQRVSQLPDATMRQVEDGLRLVLAFP